MKTKAQYQAAVDEIAEVCRKHEIMLVGTCDAEGVLGEITLSDTNGLHGWKDVKEEFNLVTKARTDSIHYSVNAIAPKKD